MVDSPQTLKVIDTLRLHCYLGKHRHFSASSRTNRLHVWFGLPAVMLSVILGSTFFVLLTKEIPVEAKWMGAFGALFVALLTAMQTFFNFQKTSESHRTVANQYLSIQRECERLIASFRDELIDLQVLADRLTELQGRYEEVNKAAESLRTSAADYEEAKRNLRELEAGERDRDSKG